jgi:hypothetical protein
MMHITNSAYNKWIITDNIVLNAKTWTHFSKYITVRSGIFKLLTIGVKVLSKKKHTPDEINGTKLYQIIAPTIVFWHLITQ